MIIRKAYKIQLNILYTIYNIIEKHFFSVNNLNEHFSSFNPDIIKQNWHSHCSKGPPSNEHAE